MPSWSRHKLPYYFVDTEPMCEHANSVCVLQPVRIAAIHDPPVSPRLSFRSSCIPGLFTVGATGWPLLAVSRLLERPALHGSSRTKASKTPFTQRSEQARCPPGPGVHTGAQAQAAPSQDDAVDRPAQGLGLPCCSPPRPFSPPRRPPGGRQWQPRYQKLAPLATAAARRGGGPIFPAAPAVGMVGRGTALSGSAVTGGCSWHSCARPRRRYHGRTMRRIAGAKTSSPAPTANFGHCHSVSEACTCLASCHGRRRGHHWHCMDPAGGPSPEG